MLFNDYVISLYSERGDHCAAVVTHSPPTPEVGSSNPGPYVGKLVVAYRWSAVYSTEPRPTVCTGFLCP